MKISYANRANREDAENIKYNASANVNRLFPLTVPWWVHETWVAKFLWPPSWHVCGVEMISMTSFCPPLLPMPQQAFFQSWSCFMYCCDLSLSELPYCPQIWQEKLGEVPLQASNCVAVPARPLISLISYQDTYKHKKISWKLSKDLPYSQPLHPTPSPLTPLLNATRESFLNISTPNQLIRNPLRDLPLW